RSPAGLNVVAEMTAQEAARGRWSNGADVRAILTRPAGEAVTSTGRIEATARGTVVHFPLPQGESGPWLVNVRVSTLPGASGESGALDDRIEIPVPAAAALIGAPTAFRGTASSRIPLRPVADFQFRRNERLRVEWPALKPVDQRTARVLDR